jgi:hypothetical protein
VGLLDVGVGVGDGLADVAVVDAAGDVLPSEPSVRPGIGVIAVDCWLLAWESGLPGAADVQPAKAIAAVASAASAPTA